MMPQPLSSQHHDLVVLWYLVQHSLTAYAKLVQYFGDASTAITRSALTRWSDTGIHAQHIKRAQQYLSGELDAPIGTLLEQVQQHCDFVLSPDDLYYPKQLLVYDDHPPILFGCGHVQALSQPQVAMVGSRKPSPHGKQVSYDFAYYLSEQGFYITSGLAEGIDAAAHQGALIHRRSIAVIGTGIDQCYPTGHRQLQQQIAQQGGCVISEFLPNSKALQHHFPRRNRIVSALSIGVIVVEAKKDSGSLITAKLAVDQGKQVFAIPGHIYSDYHQGCHNLIREGATLVDHPEQVIQDLALPAQWQLNANISSTEFTDTPQSASLVQSTPAEEQIPEHLFVLYQALDWQGQDLDQLVQGTQHSAAELTAYLMELELLGLCMQQSGRYLRCRQRR